MPRAFIRVYSILRVAMFVAKEIVEKRMWGNWGEIRAYVQAACRTERTTALSFVACRDGLITMFWHTSILYLHSADISLEE